MIVIMVIAAALIGGIAAAAVMLSKAANRVPEATLEEKTAAKRSEWESLASGYDASKGYDERLSGSAAYTLCKDLLGKARDGMAALEERSGTSLRLDVQLPGQDAFRTFDAQAWMKENMDRDDLERLSALADAADMLGRELEQDADEACVMASDSCDDVERMKCREMLEEAFALLSPVFRIAYSCPPEAGRSFRNEAAVSHRQLLAMAGVPAPEQDGTAPRPNTPERRQVLAESGFRCRRCGRSPLSGGRLYPAYDAHEGRYVALCENCAPRSARSGS